VYGDVINEFTGTRNLLQPIDQTWVIENDKKALKMMIQVTEL
jgi:quinolinate synthase